MYFLKTFFSLCLFLCIIGVLSVFGVFYFFGTGLPDYKQLQDYTPPVMTRFYTKDGCAFAEYAAEKRLFLPIEHIPPLVRHAFLAAEDKNFYHHFGIDFIGVYYTLTS